MKKLLFRSPILLLLLIIPEITVSSQNLKFKAFGADKGLRDNYVYNIQQDDNGYLWFGTGEGLCRFDGFNFIVNFRGDSLSGGIVDKSFKDRKGRVWFGFRDGSIAVLENTIFKVIRPDSQFIGNIVGFAENNKSEIIVATQNKGIILINDKYSLTYYTEGLEDQILSTICLTADDDLLAGTYDGLYLFHFQNETPAFRLTGKIKGIPNAKILTIVQRHDSNKYWVGTEDEGLFLMNIPGNDTQSIGITKTGASFGLAYSKIQDIFEDDERNLWVCTNGEGVFRLTPSAKDSSFSSVIQYNDQNGMPSNYVSDIFQDSENNIWFATTGQGITVLKDQAFTFFNFESPLFNDNILSLANEGNIYYLGGENGLLIKDLSRKQSDILLDSRNGLPNDKITVLHKDGYGYVWIGTAHSGIYRMKTGENFAKRFFFSQNSLENIINTIKEDKDFIWVGTNSGVISFSKKDYSKTRYTTDQKLPHNKIRDILIDSKNKIWIATRSNGLYNLTDATPLSIEPRTECEFVSIVEDKEGHIWAATDGDGVFQFKKDTLRHFSTSEGLRSNYCYSIACDANGNIWIGHRLGMSKIESKTRQITSYSVEQGISVDCNYNAVITNSNNNLVFGTSKGIILYDAGKDIKDIYPPKLNITGLRISDLDYDFTQDIYLPYKDYKIRIDFIGINLKNPEGVKYQYKLEGYDETWSEPSNILFYSPRLSDGNYTFVLRACDEMGICAESPMLKIHIKLPIWKIWWFILLMIFTLVSIVYIIIKVRERNQKLLQEFLQKSLDERTKEVREQSEEIENKNRDITDSITYAQRIQASILPPVKRMQDIFPGSFIFYQPRDIVSGDFYWYDRVGNDKFIIVCADSTGHGVPGAFMSMIGTTMIKDICSRPGVSSPSQMLMALDSEIMSALTQNVEAEKSNDGMDMIVAEFDLKAKYLRVATAMRPIILFIKGEQIYIKGSRHSVGGGHYQDEHEEKVFEDKEFQLSKGDLVYMFSDGYPDQFGGPLGKKFKMVRLKNLLRDIHDKSMEEQLNAVKINFNLWKEDYEQVDDVLFMGVRI